MTTELTTIDPSGELVGPNPMVLALPEDLTWDEWVEVGRPVVSASVGARWWLGDWLIYAEDRFGHDDEGKQIPTQIGAINELAVADTALELQTIKNAKTVSRRFPPYRRRYRVSWSHYAEVASLSDELADSLLTQAEAGDWTRETLRVEARRLKAQADAVSVEGREVAQRPTRVRFSKPLVIEDDQVRRRVLEGFRRVLSSEGLNADLLEVA